MTSITLICQGAMVKARVEGILTQGMVGIPVKLERDEAWAGLSGQLKARCGDVVRTVEAEGDTVVLPYECLLAGQRLDIGLDGRDETGALRLPTGWACCGLVQPSVADCDGEPGALPAPPEDTVSAIYHRIEALSKQIEDLPDSQVTEQTVADWGFTKNTGQYTKPASGIPETDLAPEVQEKLNDAATLEDVPGNLVLFEQTEDSEEEQTIQALLLNNLTLEADDTYIYLKFGETVLGMVEAGSGGAETVYCTDIAIDQESFTVDLSDTAVHTLTATVAPTDCTQMIRWSSSNPGVVQVSPTGELTVVGEGSATITAKCGTQSDTLTVTVVDHSIEIYFGYGASWSYGTPSAPLLGGHSARGYSSALSFDNLRLHNGSISDDTHVRAIKIEPGASYKLTYSGTDTNWYEGWCILSDTEVLNDNGWQNIGSLKEITINNSYDTGFYLYLSTKYGSAGSEVVTEELMSEFISNFTIERVV